MYRIIGIIILLVVLIIGVEFAAANAEPVTVDYFLGTVTLPLSFVVVTAFAIGVLIAFLFSLGIILPLRWRVAKLQRTVSIKDDEIGNLRTQLTRSTG